MTRAHIVAAAALAVAAAGPAHAHAAAGKVYCQNTSLRVPGTSCTKVSGKWNPANKLHFTAACRECTGGGSDLKCGTKELVTASTLELQDKSYKKVTGTFTKIGVCDFTVDLFRFSGSLAPNTTYHIVANIAGHGAIEVLAFSTSGGGTTTGDGGGTTTGDGGGTTTGDGGGTTTGDGGGTTTGDGGGTTSGDGGGGTPPEAEEGGCGCRVAGDGLAGGALAALVLLCLGFLARKRRRT
jgi:MYXO-CTERM domain-containing protein